MHSNEHIYQEFDRELDSIRSRVLSMGGLVERQINDALSALESQNIELAEYVIRTDHRVNAQEVGIDEDCTYILARRQPAAGDLRTVMAIIKTITDIERIGDESKKVARMVLEDSVREIPEFKAMLEQIGKMGELVQQLLHDALDAFARLDTDAALATAKRDEAVDERYVVLISDLLDVIREDPENIAHFHRLVWTVRSLERIGDHAKNICEYVVYLVKGKDIRHISIDEIEDVLGQ